MLKRSRLTIRATKRRRAWLILLVFLVAACIAGFTFVYRQHLTNLVEVWKETFAAESQVRVAGLRGTIFDRNFKELAQTLERVSLYARPREVTDIPRVAEQLSEILALPKSEVLAALGRDSLLVWLRRDIAQDNEERLAALHLPGIHFHREFARSYPEQEKASHLIGYSENDRGIAGVEHYYNRLLGSGRVRQDDVPEIDLQGLEQTEDSGHDLVLTLDIKIQTILEGYVAGLGNKMGSGRIASLLLNVTDGEIVAGANYPSYNPNSVWQQEHEALQSLFFTPMIIPEKIRTFFRDAALLQGGWEQGTQIYPWSLVSGEMNIARQIRLWDRVQLSTDIHVDFSGGKTPQTAVPQLVETRQEEDCGAVPKTATPLKVLLGMGHLLNGGKKIQPHILDRIVGRSSQKEYYYTAFPEKTGGRHVLPALVSSELRTLLRSDGKKAVLGARILDGETVAIMPDYSGGSYVRDRMSLVVISGEKAELLLLIVSRQDSLGPAVDKVQGAKFLTAGINATLPSMVALQQINSNIADMLELPEVEEKNFKRSRQIHPDRSAALQRMAGAHALPMPDVTGLSLRKGLRLLERAEVKVQTSGSGRIVSQSPKAGEELVKDTVVHLVLKIDPLPEDISPVELPGK